ncbi:hypothetical protein ACN20G_26705 (plasmid) [Streptomyces sp. BI20]|uniref:hypothetical protein n=1 Tax=Streptomyces sp. BI20 TaxID=3403460 RepID=UPI003C75EB09
MARRTWGTALAAMGLAATGLVGTASPASAGVIDVECVGTFGRSFSPGLSPATQPTLVTNTSTYSTCLTGASGTGVDAGTFDLSCVPVTAGPPAIETIGWNDAQGSSSTISWSAPTAVGQTVVLTGRVTSGLYAGDTATKITSGVSYLGSLPGCLLGVPVTTGTGLVDSLLLTG